MALNRRPFVPYKECFDSFIALRKEFNDLAEKGKEEFLEGFQELKLAAAQENTVAMDLLAYYYKNGVSNDNEKILAENYPRFITWELISAARGNEFAIEKLQFLIGYACDAIIEDEDFEVIAYKNDITDGNLLYVLGKAICKILVKEKKFFPVDVYQLEDNSAPFKQEYFVNFRHDIDSIIPKTIAYLKS